MSNTSTPVHLSTKFSLLFAPQSKIQSQIAITASVIGTLIALLWLDQAPEEINGGYYKIATFWLLAHAGITVLTSNNLLFLFRYFLIWILIFGTALAWGLYNGEVKVAPFGREYQTHEATTAIVASGMLALCGCSIGWNFVMQNSVLWKKYDYSNYLSKYSSNIIYIGALISYFFAIFYIANSGGFVSSTNTYGSEDRAGLGVAFGVNNIFIFLGIGLIFLGATTKNSSNLKMVLLIGGPLILCIFTGSRGDFLPQFLIVVIAIAFKNKFSKSKSLRQNLKNLGLKNIFGLILVCVSGFYLANFIGQWRHTGTLNDTSGKRESTSFIVERHEGEKMLNLETGNQILGTFYAVVCNQQLGLRDYLLGHSYIDYIL